MKVETVGIALGSKLPLYAHVFSRNSGCELATLAADAGPAFSSSATIPKADWVPVELGGKMFGQYSDKYKDKCIVGIFSVPSSIMDTYSKCIGSEHSVIFENSARAENALDTLSNDIDSWAKKTFQRTDRSEFTRIGFNAHPENLRALTHDQSGLRIGLHIDSWDGPEIKRRYRRTNRICINFGPGYRYFCFANFPIDKVETLMSHQNFDWDINTLASKFLQEFANLPITRVRVDRGFAYMAPTEALIHDGSSEGCLLPSVTYTVRGHFVPAIGSRFLLGEM